MNRASFAVSALRVSINYRKEDEVKLFVWNAPYGVSFGGSIAYAVADTVEEAREVVRRAGVSAYGHRPDKIAPSDMDVDREPDRVLDLPCAEIYEWSE